MIDLVTLDQAKMHLSQDGTYKDADIQLKIATASGMAMRRMKLTDPPAEWALGTSPETYEIPALVQGITGAIVAWLYENREGGNGADLERLLSQLPRVPTVA